MFALAWGPLDVQTLLAMTATMAVTLGGASVYMAWGQRRDELWLASGAVVLMGPAFWLYSQRGALPDLATFVLANAVLATALSVIHLAVARVEERPPDTAVLVAPVVALTIGSAILLPLPRARVAFLSLLLAVQFGLVVRRLRLVRMPGRGRGLLMLAAGGMCAVLALRTLAAALGWVDVSVLTNRNWMQTATFLFGYLALVLGTTGFVFMLKDRSDERTRYLATHDELTGLLSRRAVLQAVERDLSYARRHREPIALVMVDIDWFKQLNDTHGHLAGDEALRRLGALVHRRVRGHDLASRFGGEEFLIALPGTDAAGARELAESLREAVAAMAIDWHGRTLGITVSAGVHAVVPEEGDRLDRLLEAADAALYRAKSGGRNRVEVLDPA